MELARWLERKIEERGLSRRAVAAYAGLSSPTVLRALNGERVSPTTCRKLAAYFDENQDYVLALAGHRELQPPWESDLEYSPEVLELMSKVEKLPPAARAEAMAMIERMLDAIEAFQKSGREEKEQ